MPYRFSSCTPSFPVPSPLLCRDGTVAASLGFDGGYECALDGTRSVWTGGDTYTGPAGTSQRHGSVVVGNVVAIGSCVNGVWSQRIYAGGTAAKPTAFFESQTGFPLNSRFTAQKPFMFGGSLYVLLVSATNGPGRYSPVGSAIARVENPLDDPRTWSIDYLDLWTGRPMFGCEALVLPPDLVVFGSDGGGGMWPVKLPLATLAACPDGGDLSSSLEYWNGSDWMPGVTGADAVPCGIVTTSGLSMRYDPALIDPANGKKGVWSCLYFDTTQAKGFPPYLCQSVGQSPLGPTWTRRVLGAVPEMVPGALYHPDNVAYGPAEIVDFEKVPTGGPVVAAYSVGSLSAMSGDYDRQLRDLATYRVAVSTFANPFA